MGSRKIIMLVGSILIGALAGFALLSYVQGVEEEVENRVARVDVFVVSADVSAGETASQVTQTNRIVQKQIESSFRPSSAVTDLAQIQGRIAVSDLAANQVLVAGMFKDPETVSTSFSDLIREDHVAIGVTIPKNQAVHGFIEVGDWVDFGVRGAVINAAGDADAFETSAGQNPYKQPTRYLYRGVRVVSIGPDIVGQSAPVTDATAAATDTGPSANAADSLAITLAVPTEAAQRILSVPEEDMVLALLPKGWDPVAQGNNVLDEIITDADLPGEDPSIITPDGPAGFIDTLADEVEDATAAEDVDALLPGSAGTDDAATDDSAEGESE